MTREEMIDEVVRTNGLENKWTIWFCELAEDSSISDSALLNAMICATTMPIIENEDQGGRRADAPCAPKFHYTTSPQICQVKNQKNFKKFCVPKLGRVSVSNSVQNTCSVQKSVQTFGVHFYGQSKKRDRKCLCKLYKNCTLILYNITTCNLQSICYNSICR